MSFENAKLVFDDSHALSYCEREMEGEERWQTLGVISGSLTVLVAHTFREENGEEVIRIVSARKATASERRAYEEGIWPPS
ncbi:MAG TPA: BrnT family toxin [Terriglobia bacterium]|nr:BrnT family toxin [Terriglobia bacterium]